MFHKSHYATAQILSTQKNKYQQELAKRLEQIKNLEALIINRITTKITSDTLTVKTKLCANTKLGKGRKLKKEAKNLI